MSENAILGWFLVSILAGLIGFTAYGYVDRQRSTNMRCFASCHPRPVQMCERVDQQVMALCAEPDGGASLVVK